MTPTADTTALQAWADRLRDVMAVIHSPDRALDQCGKPPGGGTPAARIAVLRLLLRDLGWREDCDDPAQLVWQQVNGRFGNAVASTVAGLAKQIRDAVAREASRATGDPVVLVTADLPERALGFLRVGEAVPIWYATVNYDALPSEHWLRPLLPREDCWQSGGTHIVLGRAWRDSIHGLCHAQPWYGLDRVRELTGKFVREQRERQEYERRTQENRERHLMQVQQRELAARARRERADLAALQAQDRLVASEHESNRECRQIKREAALVEMEIQRERAAREVNHGG